jgi:hypothetical protein
VTPAETARLLAAAQAFDRRTVGEMDVIAWHKAIGALDFTDAVEAVARHYAESRDWIMPSDVAAGVRAIRNERASQVHHEVRELPSRFEDDVTRDIRLKAGLTHCRNVLQPILDRLQAARDSQDGELSESDQRLNLARQRAREYRRDRDMAARYVGTA